MSRIRLPLLWLALAWLPVANAADSQPALAVTTVPVQAGAVTPTVPAWGTVQPDPQRVHSLALPRAGVVERLYVRVGQTVAASAPLLEFTTAPNVQQDYAQAASALEFARGTASRSARLFAEQLITRAELDAARRDLADAQARHAALDAVAAGTIRSMLRAPVAGIVTQVNLSVGDRVAADTLALALADQQALVAVLGVEPEAAVAITAGAAVRVRSVFGTAPEFTGPVTAVQGLADPVTRLIEVRVAVPNAVSGYLIGTSVRGDIALPTQTALRVPRAALLADASGTYLFVLRQGAARRVNVTTGAPVGADIVVRSTLPTDASGALQRVLKPLQTGERVVTVGARELADGDAIQERAP